MDHQGQTEKPHAASGQLPRLALPIESRDHCLGRPGAQFSLVEYGDYESLPCADVEPIVRELVRELGDRLCFAFRNFPQPSLHPHSVRAAEAAEAADMQGKFWLLHERLFEHQDDLSEPVIQRLARELPVDMHEFERDLESGTPARQVAEDRDTGRASGVKETPTFFVNGAMYVGSHEFLPLLQALQEGAARGNRA